jgi:hypothetical protein
MKRKFLAETIRNFGVGLMVGGFLLKISERIETYEMAAVVVLGVLNVLYALYLVEE